MIFENVGILGVGLIGGSIGAGLRKYRVAERVIGWGRNEENLKFALERGFIDSYKKRPEEVIKGADAVVLSTPLGTYRDFFSLLKWENFNGTIVDVGSVKGRVLDVAGEFSFFDGRFIPSHPVAGKESGSSKNADPDLFKNALCILTPYEGIDEKRLLMVKEMWMGLGSNVLEMDAKKHDIVLAYVSHLPHITAFLYSKIAGEKGFFHYGGGSFRDATRVAGSPPEMWAEIMLWNRESLLDALKGFIDGLKEFEILLEKNDFSALKNLLEICGKYKRESK